MCPDRKKGKVYRQLLISPQSHRSACYGVTNVHEPSPSQQEVSVVSVTRLGDLCKFLLTNFLKKRPKCMLTFWAFVKTSIFIYNLLQLFFGYFIFQRLVTVSVIQAFSCYLGNYLLGCDPAGVILIETEARINDPSNVKTLAFHRLFFIYFRSFQTIYVINPVDFGGIRTWIVRV